MSELEKILKHIEEDAVAASTAVINEANSMAEEITAAAQEESKRVREEIEQKSKLEVSTSLSRSKSSALLQEKKMILNAKQQIISNLIEKARLSLLELSDQEYFATILTMVLKHAKGIQGHILFSEADKKRLPATFQNEIKEVLKKLPGAELTILEETRNIDGGFVLVYGDIEENCSFEALFSAEREILQDKVCTLLFS